MVIGIFCSDTVYSICPTQPIFTNTESAMLSNLSRKEFFRSRLLWIIIASLFIFFENVNIAKIRRTLGGCYNFDRKALLSVEWLPGEHKNCVSGSRRDHNTKHHSKATFRSSYWCMYQTSELDTFLLNAGPIIGKKTGRPQNRRECLSDTFSPPSSPPSSLWTGKWFLF